MMNDQTADAVVRSLALKAVGLTGADIERVVREARKTARREKRELAYSDIADRLESGKPKRSEESRWRRAVHEAGHVVARYHLGQGSIEAVTINGPSGRSYVDGREDLDTLDMEEAYAARIISILAGRAAEEVVLGTPSLGSGGSDQSDLAKATEIALALETVLGTGAVNRLVHTATVSPIDKMAALNVSAAVNNRLENAYEISIEIVTRFQSELLKIAQELVLKETMAKEEIETYLSLVNRQI
ncbi:hypothetical protein HB779_04695 [Phyllobacterium sp. 628]|uniref:hypothetical protein n=1 Tax=Phyllobacterium sp. 628 TaxID=2718938 RepID=UPI0016627456|nr:hypothetical protein [Phyllobacterium sp. 628]QND51273.1 hypothetical protein HB779_04695 [Phyllobacterium sp. 628]